MFEDLDKKKLALFILILVAAGALLWLIYVAFFKSPAEPGVPGGGVVNGGPIGLPNVGTGGPSVINGGTGGLPSTNGTPGGVNQPGVPGGEPIGTGGTPGQAYDQIAQGRDTATAVVSDRRTFGVSSGGGSGSRFYDPADCKLYEVDERGVRQPLGESSYCQVESIVWAPQGTATILEFPDGSNIVYDYATNKQYTLPKEMTEFSWDSSATQIAGKYLGKTSSENWIVSINVDGSSIRGVEPMGENYDKVTVEWSANNQVVALSRTGVAAGLFEQQVIPIGFNGENFPALNVEGRGFQPKWSPDGGKLLYSVYSDATDYRPTLYLVDGSLDNLGGNKRELGIATWIDKCTFTQDSAYCAAPQGLPAGAAFSRSLAANLPDTIWRIDFATGATTVVGTPVDANGNNISVANLNASTDGRYIYFIDARTGQLRQMQLR